MDTTLRIHVAGSADDISPKTMAAAFAAFAALLDAPGDGSRWKMTQARLGSFVAEACPIARTKEEEDKIFNDLTSDLEIFGATGDCPSSWTKEGRNAIRSLRELAAAPGVTSITTTAGDQTITFAPLSRATEQQRSRTSIGSVTGIIDRINTRGGCEFGLIDEAEHHPVKVRFSPNELESIKSLVGKRVCARGKLVRNNQGRKVLLHLRCIDECLSVGGVSSTDLIGMWQAPEGMDADDVVQELRRA